MEYTKALKQNHVFRRLYQKGRSAAGSCLVIYCRKNGQKINRLGLTTGVKLGHAVVRNRTRRRIHEAYRLSERSFLPGYDIVIVARHGAIDASFQELSDCLLKQAARVGLLRKDMHDEEASAVSDPNLSD